MGNSREEKIDQWIFQEGINNDRRNRIIPSSTEQISHKPVGQGLEAMEKIAFYFGDRPGLSPVELGQIKEHEVTLTFAGDVEMEPPFYPVDEEHQDQWAIQHGDALELSTGTEYGEQVMALTAIGNSLNGAKVMFNTSRWQVLGSVGLARFTSSLMVGQVMEQATEPWAKDQHLWLIGFRELGQQLATFLAPYHDESRFHLVESIEQITGEDLEGTSATLYVMGSSAATMETYDRIRSETTGMLTDTVATEQAMFISEDEDGGATVVNAGPYGLKIWPNLVGEGDPLYEAMQITWQKRQEEAQMAEKAVEEITVADFFAGDPVTTPEEPAPKMISAADLEAMMRVGSYTPTHEIEASEPEPEVAEPGPEPEVAEPEPEPEVEAAGPEPTTRGELTPHLSLMGKPQIHGADGTVTGSKAAEAAAFVYLHGHSADPLEITKAVWPEAESEGHSARTRRSRTAKKLKEALPGIFNNDSDWSLASITTDLEQITAVLGPDGDTAEGVKICHTIEPPLQGCSPWADDHRQRIHEELQQVLEVAADQALENDQFELAKAARQAFKKL